VNRCLGQSTPIPQQRSGEQSLIVPPAMREGTRAFPSRLPPHG